MLTFGILIITFYTNSERSDFYFYLSFILLSLGITGDIYMAYLYKDKIYENFRPVVNY